MTDSALDLHELSVLKIREKLISGEWNLGHLHLIMPKPLIRFVCQNIDLRYAAIKLIHLKVTIDMKTCEFKNLLKARDISLPFLNGCRLFMKLVYDKEDKSDHLIMVSHQIKKNEIVLNLKETSIKFTLDNDCLTYFVVEHNCRPPHTFRSPKFEQVSLDMWKNVEIICTWLGISVGESDTKNVLVGFNRNEFSILNHENDGYKPDFSLEEFRLYVEGLEKLYSIDQDNDKVQSVEILLDDKCNISYLHKFLQFVGSAIVRDVYDNFEGRVILQVATSYTKLYTQRLIRYK